MDTVQAPRLQTDYISKSRRLEETRTLLPLNAVPTDRHKMSHFSLEPPSSEWESGF